MRITFAILFTTILFTTTITTFNCVAADTKLEESTWGLGIVFRDPNTAFNAEEDPGSSFLPLMYYQGDTFFMRGLDAGAHLYQQNSNQFNVIGRMSLLDVPEELQNPEQKSLESYHFDFGLQWRLDLSEHSTLDIELLSDTDERAYGNITNQWYFETGDWEFMPSFTARYKSADFNSQYHALEELTNERIGAGVELSANVETRYHVNSNFYLIGSVGVTALDKNAYESSVINQRWSSEAYLGFAFFNDKARAKKDTITTKSYLRVGQGWATPSDIGDIFAGNITHDDKGNDDPYNNQSTSVFYGHPLTDEFFGAPVDIYFTPGVLWHWSSEVQDSEQEYVLAFKAYYTFNWPVRWRIGLAEGISYMSELAYIEAAEMEEKELEGSNLLNYLDISFDINVGDMFNSTSLNHVWFGYSIHHRSGVFEAAAQYGRIKGGSNYNTLYLQFDF